MPTPTLSAEMCYCGAPKQYQGENKDSLYCPHCDRACRVQQDTKEPCVRCETRNDYWSDKMLDIYGPGRGIS